MVLTVQYTIYVNKPEARAQKSRAPTGVEKFGNLLNINVFVNTIY